MKTETRVHRIINIIDKARIVNCQKKGLVRNLFIRAYRLCSQETIQQEVELLETIPKENGYPNSFIKRYSQNEILASKTASACKKNVYICLPFKWDVVSTQIEHRLGAAIGKTYYAANSILTYDTKRLLKESNVDKKSLHVTSNCIYLFSCICGSTCIGRTERILSTRISEHPPKNLTLNGSKLPTSVIGRHILDSGHVDRNLSFKVIARVKNFQSIFNQLYGELNQTFECKKICCSLSSALVNSYALEDYGFF